MIIDRTSLPAEAIKTAAKLNMRCIVFTGADGGKMEEFSRRLINAPSADKVRMQEAQNTPGHTVCEIVENTLIGHV